VFDREALRQEAQPAVDPAAIGGDRDDERRIAARREILVRQLEDIETQLKTMTPEMRVDEPGLRSRRLLLQQELSGLEFRQAAGKAEGQRLEFEQRMRSGASDRAGRGPDLGASGFRIR
jgi:hypothetical protein